MNTYDNGATSDASSRSDGTRREYQNPYQNPSDFISGTQAQISRPDAEEPRQFVENATDARHDMTGHDLTRNDEAIRDTSRLDATERETARHDVKSIEPVEQQLQSQSDVEGMNTVPHEEIQKAPNWLDVDEATKELSKRGVPRTIRTIQRMCKKGKLDCKLVPTEIGVRYLINDQSIDAFVKEHNLKMPMTKSEGEQEAGFYIERHVEQPTAPKLAETEHRHTAEIIAMKDEQIAMLKQQQEISNNQIRIKDEQISEMIERDRETNILIQTLHSMVALPEAKPQQSNTHHNVRAVE